MHPITSMKTMESHLFQNTIVIKYIVNYFMTFSIIQKYQLYFPYFLNNLSFCKLVYFIILLLRMTFNFVSFTKIMAFFSKMMAFYSKWCFLAVLFLAYRLDLHAHWLSFVYLCDFTSFEPGEWI